MHEFEIAELYRLLNNLIRFGTIVDPATLDPARECPPDRVIVESAGLVSRPLIFVVPMAGEDRKWRKPSYGEQVLIFCQGGRFENGVVMAGLFQNAFPAPGQDEHQHITEYRDGTRITYDTKKKELSASLAGSATVNLESTLDLITGSNFTVNVNGSAKVNADKIALNGGSGVVTGQSICHFTGNPHADVSATVTAGK